jgi:hypothetical protein
LFADLVDSPWDTATQLVNGLYRRKIKLDEVAINDLLNPGLDVVLTLGKDHGMELSVGTNPLLQLSELRAVKDIIQFGLTDQDNL